jgi:hypothetical protein
VKHLFPFFIYHLIIIIEYLKPQKINEILKFDTFIFLPLNNQYIKDNIIYITIPEISYESHPFSLSKYGNKQGLYIKSKGNWCNKLRNVKSKKELTIYCKGFFKSYNKKIEKTILYEKCLLIISGLHFTTITFLLNKTINKNLFIIFITNSLHEMYIFKSLINTENIQIYITKNIDKNEKEMLDFKIYNKRPNLENIIEYYSLIEKNIKVVCFTNKKITKKILKKAFYYSKWNFCQSCKFIKFDNKYKVFNKNVRGQISKGISERKEFNNFIKTV